MPITTLILAGVMAIMAKAPVQLTVDFAQATTGIAYRIEIKLYDRTGKQVGITQTIDLAAENKFEDILIFFPCAMSNVDLSVVPVAGTKKVVIKGTVADFKRIEYSTLSLNPVEGEKWIRNDNLKGPTLVGKHMAHAPSFVVNPKPF